MSNNHSGNLLNQVTFEEHDGQNNAKRVTLASGATIFAVVNTSAAGQASVVLDNSISKIGFATVHIGTPTIFAVVNTAASGQASVVVDGIKGNVTLDPGSFTGIKGNVTLSDPKGYIGLTTVTLDNNRGVSFSGNVTLDAGSKTGISGNVTLSDSKTFIGLTTTTLGASPAFIGIVTVTNASIPVTQSGTWDEVGINDSGNSITVDNNGTFAVQSTFAGNVTLDAGSKTQIVGNVTLSDSKTNIGLVTLTGGTAWADPKTYIGLVTITGSLAPAAGNITLDAGSLTGIRGNVTVEQGDDPWNVAVKGNVTISGTVNVAAIGNVTLSDSKGFIGLTTTTLGASPAFVGIVTVANASLPVTFSGNVTLDAGSKTQIVGNVTLSDSKTYIGLTTTTIGNNPVLGAGVNNIGFASVTPVMAWPDPKTYIGLVTITGSLAPAAGNITLDAGSKTQLVGTVTIQDGGNSITVDGSVGITGNVTISGTANVAVVGNVTLSDSKTFIGLTTTTLGASPAFVGIVTIANSNVRSIAGNITLSDAKTYIGLVTVGGGLSNVNVVGNVTLSDAKTFIGLVTSVPSYGSNSTVYTGVISATGAATVLVAPASSRFFIKNIHISSLGRSEVEIRSGATTIIPFTSLSTTSGYALSFGEQGLPSRAQQDGLVVNLNGAATVAYMFNVRFEA